MSQLSRFAAVACILAAFAAPASAKIERVVEKSFTVQPGVHLRVSTSGGDIHVVTSSDPVVKVVAKEHIRAGSEAEADEVLKKLDLTIEQDGNDVVATASYENGVGFHLGSWPPVQVEFVVTVPAGASAELKTSGGDVTVGDLGGAVHARTSGGNIKLGSIGGDIDASTSGGNVVLEEGRGSVRLSTSGGNVSADRVIGPADLDTSGGDIRVDSVQNTLKARTSGGDVRASFDGALKGDCSLSTSGGEVKASVAKNAAFQLDASTSGGEVDAAGITITIDHGGMGRSSLSGQVNGGGPVLRLRSSGGDIRVVTR
jgi:putative adhesin